MKMSVEQIIMRTSMMLIWANSDYIIGHMAALIV